MKVFRVIITSVIILFVIGIIWLALSKNPPSWTGFGESNFNLFTIPAKSLWDWLELLIIPVVIILVGWALNNAENSKIKQQESERAQNILVDSFIETITKLILNNYLLSNPANDILIIVRTRVIFALNNIDGLKKGQILQFLYESKLIVNKYPLNIFGANLNNAVLNEIVLQNSVIKGSYFINAKIRGANLNNAKLIGCDFTNADFSNSLMENTDFSYTNLKSAKLINMNLTSVNFEGAILKDAKLNNSKITINQLEIIRKSNNNFNPRKVIII